jgi:hypothetical protein
MLEFNLQHLYQQITWEPCDENFDHFPLTMHMSNSHFPLLMPNFILELFIPVVGGVWDKKAQTQCPYASLANSLVME